MVHCALGMVRVNRLGSPVELQVLPRQVQELQETISNLVLPNTLGRGRTEVEPLHSMVHSLHRVLLLACAGPPGCPPAGGVRPGHSPSACLAVCADAEVKQETYAVETPSWPGDKLRDYDAGIRSTAPYVVPSHLPQLHFSVEAQYKELGTHCMYVCTYVCISTVQFIDSRRALCAECPSWCVSALAHQGVIPVGSHRRVCLGLLLLASEEI